MGLALAERRGYWRAVVAIAAKNARMCWAVFKSGDAFRLPVWNQTNQVSFPPSRDALALMCKGWTCVRVTEYITEPRFRCARLTK
jgi:hypothetical protein